MPQPVLPARADVPVEHTWNTASVYATPAEFEAEVDALLARLPAITALEGRLGESPAALAEVLDEVITFRHAVQRANMYAGIESSVDTTNQEAVARQRRARALGGQARGATAFLDPGLMAIGFDTLRDWVAAEPRLRPYTHAFDQLELLAPHVRSSEVEVLLGMLADPFQTASSVHRTLTNSEISFAPALSRTGEPFEVAHGTINALTTDPDREVRRTAWENYADAHLAVKNTLATCLATQVKQSVFLARARNYPSALAAAAGENTIPTEVFHNLLAVFQRNLPTWHRYWRIRRKALGLETLREYDVKAPLTSSKPHVPYQQAVEWIVEGMRPLGDEYTSTVRRGCLEQRWVDIYPNRGKGEGAYSSGVAGTPPFIFMNYNDDLFSMSTLAHEIGHSMHSYLTSRTQPLIYDDYTIFAAEVASNFNQALVRDYLFRTQPDRSFQIAVIEEFMSNFHRYFFIMPTLARFELEIHERDERNRPLTADSMNELMADLFAEAYGGEVEMDRTRTGSTWGQFSTHLYLNFYVYQYATGISGAHALAKPILAGDEAAARRYLDFLSAGSSLYPLDALRRAGVDLTSPEPVEQTFAVLATMVDRLERLLDAEAAQPAA